MLVLYNFYKNFILLVPQCWYGTLNGMSGTTLYEPILFQCFNIFYTALPIYLYALFDREYTDRILSYNPVFYLPSKHNYLFNNVNFWF